MFPFTATHSPNHSLHCLHGDELWWLLGLALWLLSMWEPWPQKELPALTGDQVAWIQDWKLQRTHSGEQPRGGKPPALWTSPLFEAPDLEEARGSDAVLKLSSAGESIVREIQDSLIPLWWMDIPICRCLEYWDPSLVRGSPWWRQYGCAFSLGHFRFPFHSLGNPGFQYSRVPFKRGSRDLWDFWWAV